VSGDILNALCIFIITVKRRKSRQQYGNRQCFPNEVPGSHLTGFRRDFMTCSALLSVGHPLQTRKAAMLTHHYTTNASFLRTWVPAQVCLLAVGP
jgi:hypothetical protein